MLEAFIISVAQLMVAAVILGALLVAGAIVFWSIVRAVQPPSASLWIPDEAVMPRAGGWQYPTDIDAFFNKIEEFRSDFV